MPVKYKPKQPIKKICPVCGCEFETPRESHMVCSEDCRKKRMYLRCYGQRFKLNLPASTIGTISEMMVCQDLLKSGYYVFRSISPNSPFDIIASKNGSLIKIEVRTAAKRIDGSWGVNKKTGHENDMYDTIAAVLVGTGEIKYIPPINIDAQI
jgi:Holliday junction resolvase-like predicted endonuclease